MKDTITLTLNRQDLDQLLEGLSEQAEAWERGSEALRDSRSGTLEAGSQKEIAWPNSAGFGGRNDHSDRLRRYEFALACAAMDRMAARYRDIMDKILEQAGI